MPKLIGRNRQGFANSSVISSKTLGGESLSGPTSDSDFYIASDSATESQHTIIHINDNKVVAGWIDGSNRPYVAVGSVGSDGTTTWGTPSAVNGTTVSLDIDLVHLSDDKFMVLYDEGGSLDSSVSASDQELYGKVGSISSTTVSSYGTALKLNVDYSSDYRGIDGPNAGHRLASVNVYNAVRIGENKVFLVYRGSLRHRRAILTVSGTTITKASDSGGFNQTSSSVQNVRNIRCAVSPDNENHVMVYYAAGDQPTWQYLMSFVIDGTSVSSSSHKLLAYTANIWYRGMDEDAFDICWLNSTKVALTIRLGSVGSESAYSSPFSEGDTVVGVFEFNGTDNIGTTGGTISATSIVSDNSTSGARLTRISDTKIGAIYRNGDDSNTLYYIIGTLGGSDSIVWDTAVDTNLTGTVGSNAIEITKNIRNSDLRSVLFVKTATAFTGGHTDNAVSSAIQDSNTIETYRDTGKFLSSVWSLKDQNKKISKGEWIRNDVADTGANGRGKVIKGAGLEDTNHRWYEAPAGTPVTIKAYGAGGGGGKHNGSYPISLDGGDGGVNQATFDIPAGTQLNVIVGQGGQGYQPGAGGTFGGGDGQGTTGPGQGGGGGGGYSGVFEGPATQGNALIIAGGGGGSGGNAPGQQGGDGGMNPFTAGPLPGAYSGNPGEQGSPNPGETGGGGTVSAGGSSNSGSGSALQGGDSGPGNGGYNSSGGGGGGYYGGGAGTGYGLGERQGSGGGGSAYTNTSAYSAVQEPNSNILSSLTQKSGGAGSFNSTDASDGADGSVEIIDGAGPTVYSYTGSVQTHTVS
jgi:hypothetical protein